MKIIQIIKDGDKLLGLGDDGIIYIQTYTYDHTDSGAGEMWLWKRLFGKDYETKNGIYFEENDMVFENHTAGSQLSTDINNRIKEI